VKVAAAPISWGVSEAAGWGYRMAPARVLAEMRQLGFEATELGPPGYLPPDAAARRELLQRHGLRLVAGFLAAVLHDPAFPAATHVRDEAKLLASSGAEVLVLAAAFSGGSYDAGRRLDAGEWKRLARTVREAEDIASGSGLTLAFHPHAGTAVATAEDVRMFLDATHVALCLDTGHIFLGGAEPATIARTAADRVGHVHLKDVRTAVAARVRSGDLSYTEAVRQGLYASLGQGDLDIEGVYDRLRKAGYQGWFVLEQDTALTAEPAPQEGPAAAARQSLEYFGRIAGAKQATSAIKEE